MKHEIIEHFNLDEIWNHLNEETLFAARWQLRQNRSQEEWESIRNEVAYPTLQRMKSVALMSRSFEPKAVFAEFKCKKIGNGLLVHGEKKDVRFDFPREFKSPNRCIADFFSDGSIILALVTIGDGANVQAKKFHEEGKFSDLFYIKGLAAETTEALMKLLHSMIRKEYRQDNGTGERFSFGYPALPNLAYQRDLVNLLDGRNIGVSVTKTFQLVPEFSTSAIISFDKKAGYFVP